MSDPRVRPMGAEHLRVALRHDQASLGALLERVARVEGVLAVQGAERYVLVQYDAARAPAEAALLHAVDAPLSEREGAAAGPARVLAVRYDGEDLEAVARALGLRVEALVALHTGCEYSVRMLGFVPGFAYLGPVPEALRLPRRSSPRPRVPANAVALADRYTGIYPAASPGGWHLLGTALNFCALDPLAGATLRVGERVRFEAVA